MTPNFANQLAQEKSPYLLQHADNPVNWSPWSQTAFEKAQREDKPIFLSIGYSTCHWCHVMEHESFENLEIAKILNDHFVAVKVDREERPDIDNIYMTAVTALTGQGGWPLSVFLTPDQKPFYGGTYFPPYAKWGVPGFKDVLLTIHESWMKKRDQVLESSQSITHLLQERAGASQGDQSLINKEVLQKAFFQLRNSFDKNYGGFGSAPKFPMGHSLSFLLRFWMITPQPHHLDLVETTLRNMTQGGIYDQLGGGFHRYSTDAQWQIPHFEKMLYDQAILSRVYLEAYQATHKEEYAQVAKAVFDYVLREMQDPSGGFYSAEDADSLEPESSNQDTSSGKSEEKKEGAFYLWSFKDIGILTEEERAIMSFYFGLIPGGNALSDPQGEFQGKNILWIKHSFSETAQHFQKEESAIRSILGQAKRKLFAQRRNRPRPHLDDKILVDWNGLMIASLSLGAKVLKEPSFLHAAEKAARFIIDRLISPHGRLLHRYRDGQAAIQGTLEDYAFFIHGLLDLYESTFDPFYIKKAIQLSEEMLRLFWDQKEGGFFLTAIDAESLIFRSKEIYDGALPSGNSIAGLIIFRLAHFTMNANWTELGEKLFRTFGQDVLKRPSAFTQFLIAYDFSLGPVQEIVLSGEKRSVLIQSMWQTIFDRLHPRRVILHYDPLSQGAKETMALAPFVKNQYPIDGNPTAYVCENHICQLPVGDLEAFDELMP